MKSLLILVFLLHLVSIDVFAGSIRDVYVNSKKMENIYLKMGQSTVLRFREKPKKVILGNSNYFHVEFIENDITIQPQDQVNTNIFIYGQYHTFGFNLIVKPHGRFDDLVNVKWKSPYRKPKRSKSKKKKLSYSKPYTETITLKKGLILRFKKIQQDDHLNMTIIDFEVENKSKNLLKESEIEIFFTRAQKRLHGQQVVFKSPEIKASGNTSVRAIIRPKQIKGFSFEMEFKDQKVKKIISRRLL